MEPTPAGLRYQHVGCRSFLDGTNLACEGGEYFEEDSRIARSRIVPDDRRGNGSGSRGGNADGSGDHQSAKEGQG